MKLLLYYYPNQIVSFSMLTHTAILQQTTFRKTLNVHSAERNEHFFKLESFEHIVANEEIAPAILPLSQCFQMSSPAAGVKTSIYGVKGKITNECINCLHFTRMSV